MIVKYLNITYKCNSSCLFCAADLGIHHNESEEMSYEKLVDILEESSLGEGDRIILNGGEPTLHKDFIEIVRLCADKKLFIDIYTNGKLFSDVMFCDKVLKKGKFHIRIPLFGLKDKHDFLTGRKGNYQQTLEGINQLVKSGAFIDGRLTVEIKLLLAKCCLEENAKIIDELSKYQILDNVEISLNPLLISEKVKINADFFVDTYSQMIQDSKLLFERASLYKKDIDINLIPYCVLPSEYLLQKKINWTSSNVNNVVEYSDNKIESDKMLFKGNHKGDGKCDICVFEKICPKFPESYLNYCGKGEIRPISEERVWEKK